MKKTILVDMDDTIENCTEAWVNFLNRRYGTDVDPDSITEWVVSAAFPTLTHEQVYDCVIEDEFWHSVKPFEDAVYYLKKLIDDGHEIYIVTSAQYESIKVKMEDVLFRYFPYIGWDNVIIAKNKQMIRGDILIDDGIHNQVGGKYIRLLYTAPHNRAYDAGANGMIRVHNWAEIYDFISKLTEEETNEQ